jgi:hypothetical protein
MLPRFQQRPPPRRVAHHRSKQVGHKRFAQTFGTGIILATAEVINCLAPFTGRPTDFSLQLAKISTNAQRRRPVRCRLLFSLKHAATPHLLR